MVLRMEKVGCKWAASSGFEFMQLLYMEKTKCGLALIQCPLDISADEIN